MSEGVGIELGSALSYLEDKVRALVGHDEASTEFRDIVDKHLRRALNDAALVKIIGMDRPVSIFDIYQPTTLLVPRQHTISVFDLLRNQQNAVVLAGPGCGKTILLHYVFATAAKANTSIPLLFTLRWSDAAGDLSTIVKYLVKGKSVSRRSPVLLLVDGIDEVAPIERQRVAEALREYQGLTCRSFYDFPDVKAPHLEIAPFSRVDAREFVSAFARCYRAEIDADALLADLDRHGFSDFASHPLMLAMICILKSGPMPELPETALRLTQRAINTLTLRWDDSRGIRRHTGLQIDGEDRVRCMMEIAFAMTGLVESATAIEHVVGAFLVRLQKSNIPPAELLLEMAQWYGVLVPVSEMKWTFVHRTIHDYLAAKYWVESGRFDPGLVSTWNSRAAYAACLVPDATKAIVAALSKDDDLGPVVECFYNRALFNASDVARALVGYFNRVRYAAEVQHGHYASVVIKYDFFDSASDALVRAILETAVVERRSDGLDVLTAYALFEFRRRRLKLPASLRMQLQKTFPEGGYFEVSKRDKTEAVSVGEFSSV